MIVCSFYSPNGRYPALAARLNRSCERFGLRAHIQMLQDGGDWNRTTANKVNYLLQCLLDYRCPVLWLDADCELMALPTLLWQGAPDFAVYNWHADTANVNAVPYDPHKLLSSGGVIYFTYTAPAIELLVRWRDAMMLAPTSIDDQTLDMVWAQTRPPVRQLWLPKQYNWMTGLFGDPTSDVVIRHDYIDGAHRTANKEPNERPASPE